jgi:hypothetical protein
MCDVGTLFAKAAVFTGADLGLDYLKGYYAEYVAGAVEAISAGLNVWTLCNAFSHMRNDVAAYRLPELSAKIGLTAAVGMAQVYFMDWWYNGGAQQQYDASQANNMASGSHVNPDEHLTNASTHGDPGN